ncbi:LuxR C-terminal-related transcriptional regulator [Nocardioides sp. LHD-245]|uniref:helix-turn-helix transcriptional regulator n=1 Tax=Nocardioides sp. LHD-245 TaxID=3051387 RepID=UPI0027E1BAC8|nr:LuxR C-terminal-related transcriptional regulator [Nocardioides sp. LHD-245]
MAHSPGATSTPSRPFATLRRERLLELLDRAAPVTVLQAPSGFGKSTVVRQWLRSGTAPAFRWVSVGAVTGDPAALRALPDAPVVVLDGYERLGAATEAVDALVREHVLTRPGARVIVTTRATTGLLRAGEPPGAATVIDAGDLAFTAEETVRFLTQDGSDALRVAAVDVHADTDGFPLAVRAASLAPALATRRGQQARGIGGWWTIVAQDLAAQLDGPAAWRFVQDTCAAPYLDAGLAGTLSGRSPAEVADLFTGLAADGNGRWENDAAGRRVFRIVDSLRAAARGALLATDTDRHRWGTGVTATWLHGRGDHLTGLALAVAAGRHELAGRIVCAALSAVPETEVTRRLDDQLSRIPRAAVVQNPRLALARGLVLSGNPTTRQAAQEYFARVVDHPAEPPGGPDPGPRAKGRESPFFHQVARSVALRHLGRYVDAGAAARAALEILDAPDAGVALAAAHAEPLADVRAGAWRHLAFSLLQVGDLDRAHLLAGRALALARQPWSHADTTAYAVGLAAIDGRSRTAARLLGPGIEQGAAATHGLAAVGRGLLRLDRFEFADALAEHDGASYDGIGELWPFLAWTRLQALHGLGDVGAELERISAALRSRPAPPGVGENLGTAALHGLVAAVLIAQGRARDAEPLLHGTTRWTAQLAPARLLARLAAGDPAGALDLVPRLQVQAGHTVRSRAAVATLGAAAALRAGCRDAAGALLDQAAARYAEHGARAHLLHVPADDLAALREHALRHDDAAAAYLDADVVAAVRGRAGALDPGSDAAPLTGQEIAVLRASLDHPRRSQVAAALHLSPETVKSHMRSIYRKWGVNSREAAIERGIQLCVLGGPTP